jgi:hypothetical protein
MTVARHPTAVGHGSVERLGFVPHSFEQAAVAFGGTTAAFGTLEERLEDGFARLLKFFRRG